MKRLNDRHLKWLAWSVAGAALLLFAISAIFVYLNPGTQFAYWGSGLGFGVAYSLLGAVIISRLPRHGMGWLFSASAVWSLESLFGAYGAYSVAGQGPAASGLWVAWISRWFWMPAALCIVLIIFLFPTGHFLSPRWRIVSWAGIAGTLLYCIAIALLPGDPPTGIGFSFINPVSLTGAESILMLSRNVGGPLFGITSIAAVISLVIRLVRSDGQERLQLKWFVFAGALSISLLTLGNEIFHVLTAFGQEGVVFGAVMLGTATSMLMPVAAGIAILRYRLYDIDIIIRRTLIYGTLTASLALVYYASVVLLERFLHVVTGHQQSDIVIILSTLTIAALFAPLRRRIRELIDRRFYRRKYDAAQVLAAFAATARDEVDLNRLTQELLSVVEETMQPTQSSLWLKEAEPRRK